MTKLSKEQLRYFNDRLESIIYLPVSQLKRDHTIKARHFFGEQLVEAVRKGELPRPTTEQLLDALAESGTRCRQLAEELRPGWVDVKFPRRDFIPEPWASQIQALYDLEQDTADRVILGGDAAEALAIAAARVAQIANPKR